MRLIDADELTKDFNTFTGSFVMTTDKCGNFVISCNAPTAFDIDKVVQELESELRFYENRMSEMGGTDRDIEDWGAIKRLKDAIEIVKRGGANE